MILLVLSSLDLQIIPESSSYEFAKIKEIQIGNVESLSVFIHSHLSVDDIKVNANLAEDMEEKRKNGTECVEEEEMFEMDALRNPNGPVVQKHSEVDITSITV